MDDLRSLLARVAMGDPTAARDIRALAARLVALAEDIEAQEAAKDPGGMADRVRMNVVGPTGEIKQTVDTGAP